MNNSSIFQKALPHIVALVSFLLISCIYFSPQLNGKVVQAGDTVSHKGMSQEIRDHYEKTGEKTLWTNAMFGGMPTYQINSSQPSNVLKYVERLSQLFIARPIGYFVAMMIGFYITLILLGVNSWLSIIGAIAFSMTTNNLVLFGAGHMTKIRTFAYFGFIFAGIVLAFRKKYLLGGIIFALGLGVNLYANHVQMTYYFFLALSIYGIIEMVQHIQRGEANAFGKAVLYLGIGGLMAVASSASGLWTTYEYSKDTMRGKPILAKEANVSTTSSNTEGLDKDYAMRYSNGWLDLASSFIPGVVGGGGGEPVSETSAFAKEIKKRGGSVRNLRAPLYWGSVGKQVSTAGPVYFGAGIFFLFILGMFVVKGSIKWGIGAGVLLTMLLSLGDNFWAFNGLFFDYFPMYNKFRTPNSVLAITSFLVPLLGILAVSEILKGKTSKKELIKSLYMALGIMGGICLFFALLGSSFFEFTSPLRDGNYVSNYGMNLAALKADRASLMQSDSLRSLAIILGTAGLLWAYLTDKLKQNFLLAGIALITVGDLWTVGKRYLDSDKFVAKKSYESYKKPRVADTEILKDKSLSYRVFDFTIDVWNSSSTSYFHKTIGGYHPAKLQRYQDLIERHIQPETSALRNGLSKAKSLADIAPLMARMPVLNMLNSKFFIANPEGAPIRNTNALGNVWFVNDYQVVITPNDEINKLKGLNTGSTAIIHQEFNDYLGGLNIQKNGTITLTSYAPNKLVYTSNTTSEQLAVFSEIWYGPNKGWQAYIDGEPVDHIRANYALRAMKIPAGQHTIEFKFDPKAYSIGKMITLVFSLAILGAFLWLMYSSFQNASKNGAFVSETQPKVATKKTPIKKTQSKKRKKK